MIVYLVGVPGSGKTYKAVYTIFNNFSTDEKAKKDVKKDYYNCYTNINEFKFDKVHDVNPLDFDDLKRKLKQLHRYYKDKVTDEFLIEKCKEYEIYKTLFVIDECHNIFDKNDPVLIWWLSYHRHLYQDIFLITQNLSLVFGKYKSFSEYFYRAKATTVSLNRNTFKYDVYINSRLSMNARSHTEKLPKVKEVFELYQSGDSVNSKNILVRFIIFSLIMIFLGVVFAYAYFSDSYPEEVFDNKPIDNNSTSVVIDKNSQNVSASSINSHDSIDPNNRQFFNLTCNNTNCYNKDILLPLALLEYFIKNQSITFFYSVKINKNSSKFYLDSTDDFYKYISNKRRKDDDYKTVDDTSTHSSVFSSK
ncbi:zonular occludens toxin domain-containing protein [Sulfurimonas xiamenensis]|uniref:Zona occludens toxin N-terminal domain-containing protein n=1 Tax=Sulfurimonas xiamenensis TaxID=2590021 RepID=A0AAJ4A478_9BACT|nr:zonular occludens toxin domain-containing protein [Sulfurimonas xiamenensis]QFR43620.1 hypothetical protein FJR47_06730 [Sulfurimonas xiamenensis]